MKAKMIKKILAVMLAASTVMSMSGLVMAGPNDPKDENSKKTLGQKRSRDDEENESDEEESKGAKKLKIGEDQYIKINQSKKAKKKSDDEGQIKEEKKANDSDLDEMDIQESNLVSRFNDLFSEDFKDDSEKMEFADVVRDLSNSDFFNKYSNSEIKKLMQKLIQCSKLNNDKVKSDVSQAMTSTAVKCKLNKENIADLLVILDLCSQTDNCKAKLNVVNFISTVTNDELCGEFNNQQINSLVAILNRCSDAADEETAKCAVKATETMLQKGVFDKFASEQMDDMTAIWLKCSIFPEARQSVVSAVALMIKTYSTAQFQNQQINNLIEILARCSETDNQEVKKKITRIAAIMSRDASFNIQQIQTLAHILKQCLMTSKASSVKKFAAIAIYNLIQRALVEGTFHRAGLGDECEKELIGELTRQLIVCSDSAEAQTYVIRSIGRMARQSLLIGHGKEQLVEISNMLVGLSNNFYVKSDVALAIGCLAHGGLVRGGFFAGFDKEQRLELTKALINCSKNSNAQADVAYAIGCFISGGLLQGYSAIEIGELEAALISCSDQYDAKPYVASVISTLARVGWFRGRDKKQIVDIVNVLRSCLENANAKKGVARAIGYLTYAGCFKDFSKDEFEDILSLFMSCIKRN